MTPAARLSAAIEVVGAIESERRVRIRSIVMDRAETLLNVLDCDKNAPRQFKLHKIVAARCL